MTSPHLVHVRKVERTSPIAAAELKRLLLALLRAMGVSSADLRVLVVGEAAMRRWNRDTFGKDRPTDVISFPEDDPATSDPGRVAGDVLLCPALCLAGTEGWEGSPEERVFYYLVHAVLHIQGHDHLGDPAAARRMRRREKNLFRAVTGRDPG